MIRAVSTFSAEMRELRETLEMYKEQFVVDYSKFAETFRTDPTPHNGAIEETLRWYKSVDADQWQIAAGTSPC
jgi:hypothetical protein